MDPTPVIAVVLALGLILGANAEEGGELGPLIQPTAALIVLGGTLGSTWLASTPAELKVLRTMLPRLLFPKLGNRQRILDDALRIANLARREGMLAVESELASVESDLLKRGLSMLVDGQSIEQVVDMLETSIDLDCHHKANSSKLLETAGGFCPTIGILGAVLGLITIMRNLADPSSLGGGIAVAFVATLYGVGFANILFIPAGNRLKKLAENDAADGAMVITALTGIANGASARLVTEMLSPWAHGHAPSGDGAAAQKAA